jgi:hypothetical protein
MPKLIKHDNRAHALLSASGAERWMMCPPSTRLNEKIPDSTSTYAEEGTLAHELAELHLSKHLKLYPVYEANRKLAEIQKSKYYSNDMEDYVETYVNYVLEKYNEIATQEGGAEIFIEVKVDLNTYIPGGFGTCDVGIVSKTSITMIDLKYGAGVPVYATNNTQLKVYGLGLLNSVELIYDVQNVNLCICQPRLDSISEWSISAQELIQWAEKEVAPKAKISFAGDGDFNPGSWCQFCKAKPRCRALHDKSITQAVKEFADPNLLSDHEVLSLYLESSNITSYINSVGVYVESKMNSSKPYTELKFVSGRGRRVMQDEKELAKALVNRGLADEEIYKKSLRSFTDLKKRIGNVDFKNIVEPHLIHVSGKPKLVSVNDNREEFSSASKDFSK